VIVVGLVEGVVGLLVGVVGIVVGVLGLIVGFVGLVSVETVLIAGAVKVEFPEPFAGAVKVEFHLTTCVKGFLFALSVLIYTSQWLNTCSQISAFPGQPGDE
jgi:hypothetical protein